MQNFYFRLGSGWEEVVHKEPLEETSELPDEMDDEMDASNPSETPTVKRRSVAQLLPSMFEKF